MISNLISCSPCPFAALQVQLINDAVHKAQPRTKLHGLAPIADPSDEIIKGLLAALHWDMHQRRFGLTAVGLEGLEKLHALSVELLELLKEKHALQNQRARGLEFRKGAQNSSQGV
jgi:hypothetical protein